MRASAIIVSLLAVVSVEGLETYSCKGSGLCGKIIYQSDCDRAMNKINPNKEYYSGGDNSGECSRHNIYGHGCGVFVQGNRSKDGSLCTATGKQLKDWYGHIRARGGCKICGSVSFDDPLNSGCKIKIDYVTGCKHE
ncbi:hypothetical protein FDECE_6752 [Fusarium decemcellulare]|nr:hypothetical protein FDECE_6752 [Fusarium decemcellulare]